MLTTFLQRRTLLHSYNAGLHIVKVQKSIVHVVFLGEPWNWSLRVIGLDSG